MDGPMISIPQLTFVDDSINTWIKQFRSLASLNSWNNEEELAILRLIIHENFLSTISQCDDFETLLIELISIEYNPATVKKYEIHIKYIKQASFDSFESFYQEFTSAIEKIKLCYRRNGELLLPNEIRNYFFNALDFQTRKILLREDIEDVEKAQKYITKYEILKCEFINDYRPTITQKITTDHESYKKSVKWCRVHKTNTHSNDECFKQKQMKKPTNEKERNLIVKELCNGISQINLEGSIQDLPVKCIVDTGAQKNYIRSEIACKLNIKPNKMEEGTIVQFANGETEKVEQFIETELKLKETPHVTYPIRLLQLSQLPVDINIGME
jgi:hypothetical protein